MTRRYLAVPDDRREAIAHLSPIYGGQLEDGRTAAKIVCELGTLPEGVEDLGGDGPVVLELLAPDPEDWP